MRFSRVALVGAIVSSAQAMKGVQTGPLAGSAYASNMIYDGTQVFMVGNTYDPKIGKDGPSAEATSQSSCFITSLDVGYFEDGWDWAQTFGHPNVLESCHGLGQVNPTSLVVLGNSEADGLYASDASKLSGFLMALDKSNFQVTSGSTLDTSSEAKIPYPIAITTNGRSEMYVVALTSTDDAVASDSSRSATPSFPNWIMNEKYGSSFDMSVMKFSFEQPIVFGVPNGPSELTNKWTQEFPVDALEDGLLPRVYIGGMILKNEDFLVVAGSTRGLGPTYGNAWGDDEDGFLTLLNPATGQLLQNQKSQSRIGSDEDDLITGICDNPNDPGSFYVVGATKGDIDGIQDDQLDIVPFSVQPFIKKVSVSTLHGIWTVQWGAVKGDLPTTAYALGCAVHGDTVYVAGNVEGSAGMVQGYDVKQSQGGDDIWVARLSDSGSDYKVNWIQQVGTAGNERVARYGGIVADDEGNAIVYGDTTGSLFRSRENEGEISDIFVMTLDKEDNNQDVPLPPPPSTPDNSKPNENPIPVSSVDFDGIQSGPSAGSAYASSMLYDESSDEVYLVGNTYDQDLGKGYSNGASMQSSCFVAPMHLSQSSADFSSAQVYGGGDVLQSCHGLGTLSNNDFFLFGNSEPDGFYGKDGAKMTGFASIVNKNSMQTEGRPVGFSMSDRTKIPYPIAGVSDSSSNVYVVATTSTDDALSNQYDEEVSRSFPNWIQTEKYGTSFDMSVMKLSHTAGSVLSPAWTQEFPIDPTPNGAVPRAFIGGLIVKNDAFLIAAGSTRGVGDGYGDAWAGDADGYITLLDLETGGLVQGRKNQERIGSDDDDLVTGICDNPNDPNSFYVVGATKGDMGGIQDNQLAIKDNSMQAFIKKMSLDPLHGIGVWTVQWGALRGDLQTSAYALGCSVVGDKVYVAGNVENGAGMVKGYDVEESSGGDDVWVAQLTDFGQDYDVNWMQQVGSRGDDRLARFGGIVTDRDGNAIIYGDTNGSMFRNRGDEPGSDLFVMSLRHEDGHSNKPTSTTIDDNPSHPFDSDEYEEPKLQPPPQQNTDLAESSDTSLPGAAAFAVAAVVILAVAICFFIASRHYARKRAEEHTTSTFEYLQNFDVEDVDLRRSPPGGWHGTYLNKLAYGVEDPDIQGPMPEVSISSPTSPLTHNSIANDSLFMDRGNLIGRAEAPSLGYRDDPPEGGESVAHLYDGLSSVSQSFDSTAPELRQSASREII